MARTVRTTNDGLTVKLNFWSLKKYEQKFDAEKARHHIKGQALNVNTGQARFFRDAGALLTVLSDWHAEQLRRLRGKALR